MGKDKKIKLWALVMLIFVPTFGFGNIASNAVYLGPAAIPSWVIVSILYFLPLCGIIAEMASANRDKEGGIYSWINKSLGEKWAFVGTWTYFIGILFYLQMVFSRIPVAASWAILGRNVFTDSNAYLLPILSIVICIAMTYIATIGVSKFSKLADFGGQFTLGATVIFILMAIVGYFMGTPSATEFTVQSGIEVVGGLVDQTENPKKTFPKAMIIATALIAFSYILGSVAIQFIASPEVLQKAGIQDAGYVVYYILANNFGINGKVIVQVYAAINLITSIAAYIIWMESPIRAMFGEVPKGTFPSFLTKKRKDGTLVNALWTQCAILVVLISIPLLGIGSINDFFKLLTDLSSLAVVVPYVVLICAFISFRKHNKDLDFKFFKSDALAYTVAGIALVLSCAGFFGAGLQDIVGSSGKEATILIIKTYGGPVILMALGLVLRALSEKSYKNKSLGKEDIEVEIVEESICE